MKPLSRIRRLVYLITAVLMFCTVVPVVFLYAGGWRYKAGFGFVRTGGIFVSVPYDSAIVSLDGKPAGESGFLNHRLYLSDLAPSAYLVRVEKPGYRTWEKMLVVEPELVTDAQALLIPDPVPLHKYVVGTSAATDTIPVSRTRLQTVAAAFLPKATSTAATSTEDTMLATRDGELFLEWIGDGKIPSKFCGRPSYCVTEFSLSGPGKEVTDAFFFSSGVIYATKRDGVFYTEVDMRPVQTTAVIDGHPGADARIVDGALVIKDGTTYYQVEGI